MHILTSHAHTKADNMLNWRDDRRTLGGKSVTGAMTVRRFEDGLATGVTTHGGMKSVTGVTMKRRWNGILVTTSTHA